MNKSVSVEEFKKAFKKKINNMLPRISIIETTPHKSILLSYKRYAGKEGRIRSSLMEKRVESSRTVIKPNPIIEPEEISIPLINHNTESKSRIKSKMNSKIVCKCKRCQKALSNPIRKNNKHICSNCGYHNSVNIMLV